MPGSRRVVPLEGVGTGASGPACLYVLPCAYEDFAKLGIATDPMRRMQAFSSRYYEFFDLERGWLAEAESVREARQWETRLKRTLRAHAAPPPLLVPGEAAGHTEWFRGAQPALEGARDDLVQQGFVVHVSLRDWVVRRLREHRELLESGERAATARFGPIDAWPAAVSDPSLSRLRDALDAYRVLEVDLDDAVSPGLLAWLGRNSLSAH
jgi:predicted GIY-YIG superfamily endonuclease